MEQISIIKMQDDGETRSAVTGLLSDAFGKEFVFMTKNKEKLAEAYGHIFNAGNCYTAYIDGVLAGMLAISDKNARACRFDRSTVTKVLGRFRSLFAALDMSKELNYHIHLPDGTGFIEYIATAKNMRGRGVASALISYVINELHYKEYFLEVYKKNKNAIRLYKKIGFKPTNHSPFLPWGKQRKLVMQYINN